MNPIIDRVVGYVDNYLAFRELHTGLFVLIALIVVGFHRIPKNP